MALNTTQAIFRSGGGDQSRTAYCGSMVMTAQFYIEDASVATATDVMVQEDGAELILPQGAVVLSIYIPTATASTGTVDIGTVGVSSGATSTVIATGLNIATGGEVGGDLSGTPLAQMSYVTVKNNTAGTGSVSGYMVYFVADPIVGQENV